MEFSHALADLVTKVSQSSKKPLSDDEREQMLQDQFAENLSESTLRWEIKKIRKNNSDQKFIDLRTTALDWANENARTSSKRRAAAVEEHIPDLKLRDVQAESALVNKSILIEKQLKDHFEMVQAALARTQDLIMSAGIVGGAQPRGAAAPLQYDAPPFHPQKPPPPAEFRQPDQQQPSMYGRRRGHCRQCKEWGHYKFECRSLPSRNFERTPSGEQGNEMAQPKRTW